MRFLCTCFFLIAATGASMAQTAATQTASTPDPSAAAVPVKSALAPAIAAVRGTIVFDGPISSSATSAGKEIKGKLKESVTLPNGQVLPKGTPLRGHVTLTSKHSKALPNGALVLTFDEATPKNSPSIPLIVKIEALAPSGIVTSSTLPVKGGMVSYNANSGGGAQMFSQFNDHSDLTGKYNSTGLKDVYLQSSSQGSGIVFTPKDDVYLDDGILITLLMAQAPAKTN